MKMRKKSDLPSKLCEVCGLSFAWRKKWEKDWASVKYCSERCRRGRSSAPAKHFTNSSAIASVKTT